MSKTQTLALIKSLDWKALKSALAAYPDLLNARGPKGENLLHLCCGVDFTKRSRRKKESLKTAATLLDAGLDINAEAFTEGDWKATPLWYAIGRGKNLELAKYSDAKHIRMFLEHGANIDLKDGEGTTVRALLNRARDPRYPALLA